VIQSIVFNFSSVLLYARANHRCFNLSAKCVDVDNGFGGVATRVAELMSDELPKAASLAFGIETLDARANIRAAASRAVALNALRQSSSLYIPICTTALYYNCLSIVYEMVVVIDRSNDEWRRVWSDQFS
jgi:hypothetical protein